MALLAVAGMFGFWIWAFSPFTNFNHPDDLMLPEYSEPAEQRCLQARQYQESLGLNPAPEGPEALLAVSEVVTPILRQMVAALNKLANRVTDPEDRQTIELWLADWDTYLDDRRAAEEQLRQDEASPFTYTARAGRTLPEIITRFAQVNDMASCEATEGII